MQANCMVLWLQTNGKFENLHHRCWFESYPSIHIGQVFRCWFEELHGDVSIYIWFAVTPCTCHVEFVISVLNNTNFWTEISYHQHRCRYPIGLHEVLECGLPFQQTTLEITGSLDCFLYGRTPLNVIRKWSYSSNGGRIKTTWVSPIKTMAVIRRTWGIMFNLLVDICLRIGLQFVFKRQWTLLVITQNNY